MSTDLSSSSLFESVPTPDFDAEATVANKFPLVPLGSVISNFDSRRIPLSSRERAERQGVFPYYGATGVMDHVDEFLFEGRHLLIAEDGSVERADGTPFLQLVDGRFWVNNHAHIVRGVDDEDTRYLYFALQTIAVRPYVSGSVQAKLTQGNLNKILIPYPANQSTRRAIAGVLGALDDKIEVNRRMGQTLEAMVRALFRSWFVNFDPVRARIDARDSELPPDLAALFPATLEATPQGELPKGWQWQTIGDLADVVGGSTPSTSKAEYWDNGRYAWATPKDLAQLSSPLLSSTERRITDEGLRQIGSGLLPIGTVLLSSRAPIGYLALTEIPVAINQGFIAMKPKSGVSNIFLWLWAEAFHEAIISRANGSTFLEISKANFRPIPALVPPEPVMTAFETLTRTMVERLSEIERESRALIATRDALLPELLTGTVCVREVAL